MLTTEGHIKMQDGVRLFFEKVGNGPQTIVILNGFTLFDDFKYLQEGRTVVSLDLRNRGRSDFIEYASKLQLGIQQDIDLRSILPSMQRVSLTPEEIGVVKSPVLTIHGTKDRSAPYGGGREWALLLPNARLLTIEGVAHAPWIESPDEVLGPIQTFFDGSWPDRAQKVETL